MGRVKEVTVDAYRALVRSRWSEAEFTRMVLDLAHLYGWRSAHFLPAMNRRGQWRTAVQGDGRGFPDLVLVRERVLWVELKVGRNQPTPDQRAWLTALQAAGQEVYLWRPESWTEIELVLKGE